MVTHRRPARCTVTEREIELRLVVRLKGGASAAFEAVYEALRPRVFSFLVRLCRRRDVAEDLLEETWLRLVTRADRLADDTCLAAWLFTVARNLYLSWCRHRALADDRLSDLTVAWTVPASGETPFETAARTETERRLEVALARIPSKDREVLLLVAAEGLAPTEAAAVLGVSPEVARKRLQRGRQRLATEMDVHRSAVRLMAG